MTLNIEATLSPSFYARETGDAREFDLTGLVGSADGSSCWPMYSFDRPAFTVWNALSRRLFERGWSDAEIRTWLQSKEARWALDGALGDALANAASACADRADKVA